MFRGYSLTALAITAALLAAGCGEEESEEPATTVVETAQPVPKLPPGWTVHRNPNAGFAFGVPPGWSVKNEGVRSEATSPDGVAAVTIGIDRTNESNSFPLEEIADSTMAQGLSGIRQLELGNPRKYDHRYEGIEITAQGVANENDIPQDITLLVLRRDDVATLSVLVFTNAEVETSGYDDDIKRMIGSLRSRPPG